MATTSTSTEFGDWDDHDTAGFLLLPAEIANQIDELICGSLYLTAPVIAGAIQVGSVGRLPTATIEVRKASRSVTVRRTDGAGLQAQIVGNSAVRSEVFARPVPELRLHHTPQPDGECRWYAYPRQHNRRDHDLIQFIRTVLSFAVAKQVQTQSSSALAESA